jgi:hypothetical protein
LVDVPTLPTSLKLEQGFGKGDPDTAAALHQAALAGYHIAVSSRR